MRRETLMLIVVALMSATCYAQTKVELSTPGSLSTLLTDAQKDTCRSLVVTGKLNSADIRTLRQMAGYGEEGGKTGRLETLDLKDAKFASDKEPFMVLDAAKEHLTGTAAYGRVKDSREVVGVPLQELHRIDYDKYRRNMHWQEPTYFWDPSVMKVNRQVTLYFTPRYFLGHKSTEDVTFAYHATKTSDVRNMEPYMTSINAEGPYQFATDLSDEEWKLMKRYKITRFSGHKVYKDEDGHYKMSVRCSRRHFFHDTFYKCTALKTVVLPRNSGVDYSVRDMVSTVSYQYPSPVVNLYYFTERQRKKLRMIPILTVSASTGEVDQTPDLPLSLPEGSSRVKINDEAVKSQTLEVLSELAVADGVTAKSLDFSGARIMTVQGDVNNIINYHVDRDYKYAYCDKDKRLYLVSDELHDLLRSQGVTRKRILFREELY